MKNLKSKLKPKQITSINDEGDDNDDDYEVEVDDEDDEGYKFQSPDKTGPNEFENIGRQNFRGEEELDDSE